MRCTISCILLVTVYWSRHEDGIGWSKFFLKSALKYPCVYYASPLLKGRVHLVRDTVTEKEFDIAL